MNTTDLLLSIVIVLQIYIIYQIKKILKIKPNSLTIDRLEPFTKDDIGISMSSSKVFEDRLNNLGNKNSS